MYCRAFWAMVAEKQPPRMAIKILLSGFQQMTGGEVTLFVLLILRHHVLADLLGVGATGVEAATLGRVGG